MTLHKTKQQFRYWRSLKTKQIKFSVRFIKRSLFAMSSTIEGKTFQKVFVYGTLKKGQPNASWFSKSTEQGGSFKFIGDAETVEKYPLIIATVYNIPHLLHCKGLGHNVHGEVYEVDDKVFADLDVLEEHPSYYVRALDDVKMLSNGDIVRVWIYFIMNFRPELLKKKTYPMYFDNCDNLKYDERENATIDDLNADI